MKLESTPKRLEITAILAELIEKLDQTEIRCATHLILGQLKAPFENLRFNIAEKLMIKILENAYSTPQKIVSDKDVTNLYNKAGDLGNVAFGLADTTKTGKLSITQVYERLCEIAKIEGNGSVDTKIKKTATLLRELDPLSAKYATRIILGITRLGFTELTFVDALSLYLKDKKLGTQIENVYYTYPEIGLIAEKIKKSGIKGISKILIETGVPILSQKAQRVSDAEEAIEKMGKVWAEYKFDGTRVQLHFDKHKPISHKNSDQTELFNDKDASYLVKTFTRNLEETTHQYPDIVQAAKQQINAQSAILDGEAIGYDKKTGTFLPFQETMQRKRKYDIGDTAKNVPLKYFVFDILLLDGKPLVNLPLRERKSLLKKTIKPGDTILIDDYLETDNAEKLHEYYTEAKGKSLEGLVVKRPGDAYQAGARSYSWVKLKKAGEKLLEDSVDCVVLGYYAGRGERSKFGIGGFLVGVYDKKSDSFKTVTKVGTGLTDEDWDYLKKMCDKVKINTIPTNVAMDKIYMPDVLVKPSIVVELIADEISDSPSHTAGYALRFPRLVKFRDDKSPSEITTVDEIKTMYRQQKRGAY
ncbi:MAG: hypothetical protein CO141_00165 [Candidatus Moranbacteria bacterium CG_4_9_14_3_um_filter_42_9]|nr:MAG: hypothetical protein CO141_00165 [Candidatus Moranbacteria bacterium CG_4_9_14_3_um_filter_42_9]